MAIALENDFEHKFYDINHPELTCTIADDLELDFFLMYILDSNRNFHNKSFLTLGFDYLLASVGDFDCQLAEKLEQLRVKTNLSNSLEMLREVVIEHRNIGHNWRFSQEQRYQLQTFSETNLFLINLIKIKGAANTHRSRPHGNRRQPSTALGRTTTPPPRYLQVVPISPTQKTNEEHDRPSSSFNPAPSTEVQARISDNQARSSENRDRTSNLQAPCAEVQRGIFSLKPQFSSICSGDRTCKKSCMNRLAIGATGAA